MSGTAFPVPKESEKFGLFEDLGIITVPEDYVHNTRLASFEKENRKKFYYWNDAITDKNFDRATTKLVPGRKLHVKVFKQIVGGTTTSEERLAFLRTQNAVLVGAQRRLARVRAEARRFAPGLLGTVPSTRRKLFGKMPAATTGCRTCAGTRTEPGTSTSAISGVSGAATTACSASATKAPRSSNAMGVDNLHAFSFIHISTLDPVVDFGLSRPRSAQFNKISPKFTTGLTGNFPLL